MTSTSTAAPVVRRWIEGHDLTDSVGPPPEPLRHGDVVTVDRVGYASHLLTLCGRQVDTTTPTPGHSEPDCVAYDRAWRAAEGIEQRDEHPVPGRRPTTKTTTKTMRTRTMAKRR